MLLAWTSIGWSRDSCLPKAGFKPGSSASLLEGHTTESLSYHDNSIKTAPVLTRPCRGRLVWGWEFKITHCLAVLAWILSSSTDLKRIQTPHSLFRDFRADKTFTTGLSGGRVQVWLLIWAPAVHLAMIVYLKIFLSNPLLKKIHLLCYWLTIHTVTQSGTWKICPEFQVFSSHLSEVAWWALSIVQNCANSTLIYV